MATSLNYLRECLKEKTIQAAMKTVRHTEGTSAEDGYNYLFGSSPHNTLRFTDMTRHPHNLQTHNGISSTAAGAYQILWDTYEGLCKTFGFTDFSPLTQDAMFCALLDQSGCLNAVKEGNILQPEIMAKMASIWASLPDSKYGQPTHSLADVTEFYNNELV